MQPVVDVREEGLEERHEAVKVVPREGVGEILHDHGGASFADAAVELQEAAHVGFPDFVVGEVQAEGGAVAFLSGFANGEVSGLPEQARDVQLVQLVGGEDALSVPFLQGGLVVVGALVHQLQQEAGRARRVPVVGELAAIVEELGDGDGVADMRLRL